MTRTPISTLVLLHCKVPHKKEKQERGTSPSPLSAAYVLHLIPRLRHCHPEDTKIRDHFHLARHALMMHSKDYLSMPSTPLKKTRNLRLAQKSQNLGLETYNLKCLTMSLWMRSQKSSTVHLVADKMTGSS